jgi:hypothetical protein
MRSHLAHQSKGDSLLEKELPFFSQRRESQATRRTLDSRHAPQAKERLSIDSKASKEYPSPTTIQKTVKAPTETHYSHLETLLQTTNSAAQTNPREIT